MPNVDWPIFWAILAALVARDILRALAYRLVRRKDRGSTDDIEEEVA